MKYKRKFSHYALSRLFDKVNQLLAEQAYAFIITPDKITEEIVIEQYTYTIYAKYDVIIKIDSCAINFPSDYIDKRILAFISKNDVNISNIREIYHKYKHINIIFLQYESSKDQNQVLFSISKDFLLKYIEYLEIDFSHVVLSESDKKHLIEIGGNNLYNIYHLISICYYNQINVHQLDKYNIPLSDYEKMIENNQGLIYILNMPASGIHKELATLIVHRDELSLYINNQYLFCNGDYIFSNINLHLKYKEYLNLDLFKLWDIFSRYIKNLDDNQDYTIITQTTWLLEKTIKLGLRIDELIDEKILVVVDTLNKLYRFSDNGKLLKLNNICRDIFINNKEKLIYIIVNEAILYEDIEEYKIANEKLTYAIELCDSSVNMHLYAYVMDEFSRLLEKTGNYREALKKLDFVQKHYKEQQNIHKLLNVQNRIGLNLCFYGNPLKAISYLERLHLGEFNGKIHGDNVFTCEVANNLSICYLETGKYDEALRLQDELYRKYLTVEKAPINYASDILQNKGNVFLYMYRYKDAMDCFKQALESEKNPVSRELILENYVYSKAFADEDYIEAIYFFEGQSINTNNPETIKMLAELYYAGGFWDKCSSLCEKFLNENSYEEYQTIYLFLDILWLKSMHAIKKLSLTNKIKGWFRLYLYTKFIQKNYGEESYYFNEIIKCKNIIRKY